MKYVVLVAWLAQVGVGLLLTVRWWRAGRPSSAVTGAHVALSTGGLVSWIAFVASDRAAWGWAGLALITVGNVAGDSLLVARTRRTSDSPRPLARSYGHALASVLRGRLPLAVTVHAVGAGVVYFGSLLACIGASR